MGILLFVCLFVCGVVNCHFLCFIQNLHFQTVTLNTASARAVVLSVQNEIGVSYLMDILLDNCKSSKFYFNFMILTKMYKLSACGDQRVNAPAAPELAGADARTAQHRHQLPGPEPADVHRIFRYCIVLLQVIPHHLLLAIP